METEALAVFGLTLEQLAVVTVWVLAVVEFAKRQFATIITGNATLILSSVVSLGVSAFIVWPDIPRGIALAVAGVIVSSAGKSLIKKAGSAGNTR